MKDGARTGENGNLIPHKSPDKSKEPNDEPSTEQINDNIKNLKEKISQLESETSKKEDNPPPKEPTKKKQNKTKEKKETNQKKEVESDNSEGSESSQEETERQPKKRKSKRKKVKKKEKKEHQEKIKKRYDTVLVEMTEEEQLRYLEYERNRLLKGINELKEENQRLKKSNLKKQRSASISESSDSSESEEERTPVKKSKKRNKKRKHSSSGSEEEDRSFQKNRRQEQLLQGDQKNLLPESLLLDSKKTPTVFKKPPRDYSVEKESSSESEQDRVTEKLREMKNEFEGENNSESKKQRKFSKRKTKERGESKVENLKREEPKMRMKKRNSSKRMTGGTKLRGYKQSNRNPSSGVIQGSIKFSNTNFNMVQKGSNPEEKSEENTKNHQNQPNAKIKNEQEGKPTKSRISPIPNRPKSEKPPQIKGLEDNSNDHGADWKFEDDAQEDTHQEAEEIKDNKDNVEHEEEKKSQSKSPLIEKMNQDPWDIESDKPKDSIEKQNHSPKLEKVENKALKNSLQVNDQKQEQELSKAWGTTTVTKETPKITDSINTNFVDSTFQNTTSQASKFIDRGGIKILNNVQADNSFDDDNSWDC